MAFLAEGLPVRLIPEQSLITPVRDDVIHHCCGHDLALRLAEGTQRMLFQEESAGLTPAAVIPTGIRTTAQPVAAPFHMILTEHLTLFAEAWTTGIAAGSSWCVGHAAPPSDNQKSTGIVDGFAALVLHGPVQRHDQSDRAVHLFRGFFFVDFTKALSIFHRSTGCPP